MEFIICMKLPWLQFQTADYKKNIIQILVMEYGLQEEMRLHQVRIFGLESVLTN